MARLTLRSGGVVAFLMCLLAMPTGASEPLFASSPAVADTLRAMAEPPIGQLPAGDQVFRFLWLRSFDRPMLVQVQKQGEAATLTFKALDRPWSSNPDGVHVGKLVASEQKRLVPAAWERLAGMRRSAFWSQRPNDPPGTTGNDGTTWILEGRSWGQYHIVERWNPQEGVFREMGMAMLELAGVNLVEERVY